MGRAGQGSGHEVHHHHFPPARCFAMFDSKVSGLEHRSATPYKKDPLKMLAEECHRRESKLFFNYSQLDCAQTLTTIREAQLPGTRTTRRGGDWKLYLDDYMDGQLRELLTYYGPIGGIWFDGMGTSRMPIGTYPKRMR